MRKGGAALSIVLLDACRVNAPPFGAQTRAALGAPRGMRVTACASDAALSSSGTVIAWACSDGEVAFDGNGGRVKNGLFTKHLLRHMAAGNTLETLLGRVKEGVAAESSQRQVPCTSVDTAGDVVLAPNVSVRLKHHAWGDAGEEHRPGEAHTPLPLLLLLVGGAFAGGALVAHAAVKRAGPQQQLAHADHAVKAERAAAAQAAARVAAAEKAEQRAAAERAAADRAARAAAAAAAERASTEQRDAEKRAAGERAAATAAAERAAAERDASQRAAAERAAAERTAKAAEKAAAERAAAEQRDAEKRAAAGRDAAAKAKAAAERAAAAQAAKAAAERAAAEKRAEAEKRSAAAAKAKADAERAAAERAATTAAAKAVAAHAAAGRAASQRVAAERAAAQKAAAAKAAAEKAAAERAAAAKAAADAAKAAADRASAQKAAAAQAAAQKAAAQRAAAERAAAASAAAKQAAAERASAERVAAQRTAETKRAAAAKETTDRAAAAKAAQRAASERAAALARVASTYDAAVARRFAARPRTAADGEAAKAAAVRGALALVRAARGVSCKPPRLLSAPTIPQAVGVVAWRLWSRRTSGDSDDEDFDDKACPAAALAAQSSLTDNMQRFASAAYALQKMARVDALRSASSRLVATVDKDQPSGDAIAQARETMIRGKQAVKAAEVLRKALATKDYDKISSAVDTAEALDIRIAELDEARAFLKTAEAAPLPSAIASGTMPQILDIARGARWQFEKFGGMRPQERFAKGRLMLASTKDKIQGGMFTYTKEVIPRSMLDLDSALGKHAISCHKSLLGFCGERKTTYPAAAGHHVLMSGVQYVELRDEIFVQLFKHLTQNPDARSTLRGWILLCLCVDMFPPTTKFGLYLLHFLSSHSADKTYGEYARYCIARQEETLDLDEAALERYILDRGLPYVDFIWSVLSGSSNPFRLSQRVPHRRPWQDFRA